MSQPHELEALTGYHLRRASSLAMSDLAERLSELGLRTTEASVLVVLRARPLTTQSEIGRQLSIKRANMAPLIAGLIARGLAMRGAPSGRSHPLRLTREGEALATGAMACMAAHDADFFGACSPEERALLAGLLNRLWRERPRADG